VLRAAYGEGACPAERDAVTKSRAKYVFLRIDGLGETVNLEDVNLELGNDEEYRSWDIPARIIVGLSRVGLGPGVDGAGLD
jgi:hypothetical protein